MYRSAFATSGILCITLAFLGQACSSSSNGNPVASTDSTTAVPVALGEVVLGSIDARYAGTASLEAWDEAKVASRSTGIVTALNVEEGDWVKAGDVLAKLDDEQLSIELVQTKAQLSKLENDHARSLGLFEKKLISQEQYDAVRYEYDRLKAAHDLKVLQLEQTKITSPISGVVSQRLIKMGNLVTTNQEVFQVTSMNRLRAIMHIPEHELGKMRLGQEVDVKADALPGMEFRGKVDLISPVIDTQTGTVKVTIAVESKPQLKPGMFCRVQLVYDRRSNAMLVPRNAVVTEDRDRFVYVVENGMAFRKPVVTGYVNDTSVEIVEGLFEGAPIITMGQNGLKDSTRVEAVQQYSSRF